MTQLTIDRDEFRRWLVSKGDGDMTCPTTGYLSQNCAIARFMVDKFGGVAGVNRHRLYVTRRAEVDLDGETPEWANLFIKAHDRLFAGERITGADLLAILDSIPGAAPPAPVQTFDFQALAERLAREPLVVNRCGQTLGASAQ